MLCYVKFYVACNLNLCENAQSTYTQFTIVTKYSETDVKEMFN